MLPARAVEYGVPEKGYEDIKTLEDTAAGLAGTCILAGWAQKPLFPFANFLLRSMFIRFIRIFSALTEKVTCTEALLLLPLFKWN